MRRASGLAGQAYEQVRTAILNGKFQPGEALFESRLADQLSMSRTPIREALQALSRDGFVQVIPERGYVLPRWSLDDLRELFELREMLEGLAARYAALRATPAQIAELERLCDVYEQADGAEAWGRAGTAFHEALLAMARNGRLATMLDTVNAQVILTRRAVLADVRGRRDEAIREHRALLEAIGARRADAAERLAREHVQLSYQALLRSSYSMA